VASRSAVSRSGGEASRRFRLHGLGADGLFGGRFRVALQARDFREVRGVLGMARFGGHRLFVGQRALARGLRRALFRDGMLARRGGKGLLGLRAAA
jgi:hypothetical protein